MANENMRNKIELYKRICEMDHKGMNWADIAKELDLSESTAFSIYLEGMTGVLFGEPDVHKVVAKVLKYDVDRKGGVVLRRGIEKVYHVSEGVFDLAMYILERDYGYERIPVVRNGREMKMLVGPDKAKTHKIQNGKDI